MRARAPPMNAAALTRQLHLAAQLDPRLAKLLARIGAPPPRMRPPGFATLLRIIVGQQVSTAAAAALWRKLERDCRGEVTWRKIRNRDADALRRCGLSRQKAQYARALAEMIAAKELRLDALDTLDDAQAIARLCEVRGVGRWSAEIYLMFALGRVDIFPAGDLALQVAVQRFESLKTRPDEKQTAKFAQQWSPHRSGVALLMWKYYGIAALDDGYGDK